MIQVYVAGASANIERAERFLERVNAHPLMMCTFDWTAAVRLERSKGTADTALTEAQRLTYSTHDMTGVHMADVFVCLAEAPMSAGQAVELGGALMRKRYQSRGPLIIVSGGNRRSIFTVADDFEFAADHEVFDDDEAFALLLAHVDKLFPRNRHTGS
jgi:hypothetical protein